jgi:large subunit ribosomal protein L30
MAGKKLKITLKKSRIGCSKHQRKILDGLGLKRCQQAVERENTPAIRGMVNKIDFMLDVQEI